MRFWYKIHKWISAACAAFFLLLCLTGLPLLFKAEVQQANQIEPRPMHTMNADYGSIWAHLPEGAAAVAQQYPGKDIKSVSLMHGQMLFRVQDKKTLLLCAPAWAWEASRSPTMCRAAPCPMLAAA